jgi:ArsR family transcriptional regulator, zinc-responsive transcriptional repressor
VASLRPDQLQEPADLLRAVASPVRLAIVLELSEGERCVHELVDATAVSQALVSQHLRVLRGARVVTGTRRGREIAYRLSDDHIAHIVLDAVHHSQEGARRNGTRRAR